MCSESVENYVFLMTCSKNVESYMFFVKPVAKMLKLCSIFLVLCKLCVFSERCSKNIENYMFLIKCVEQKIENYVFFSVTSC